MYYAHIKELIPLQFMEENEEKIRIPFPKEIGVGRKEGLLGYLVKDLDAQIKYTVKDKFRKSYRRGAKNVSRECLDTECEGTIWLNEESRSVSFSLEYRRPLHTTGSFFYISMLFDPAIEKRPLVEKIEKSLLEGYFAGKKPGQQTH